MLSITDIKIAIVSVGTLFAISGCTEPLDQTYLIGTSRPGTGFSVLGEALQEVVNRGGNARIEAADLCRRSRPKPIKRPCMRSVNPGQVEIVPILVPTPRNIQIDKVHLTRTKLYYSARNTSRTGDSTKWIDCARHLC